MTRGCLTPVDRRRALARGGAWLLCAVGIGLLPVVLRVVYAVNRGQAVDFLSIISRGDLLFLAAALLGGTLFELLEKQVNPEYSSTKTILSATTFTCAVISAAWSADLSSLLSGQEELRGISAPASGSPVLPVAAAFHPPDNALVGAASCFFLVVAILLGLRVLLLPGEKA